MQGFSPGRVFPGKYCLMLECFYVVYYNCVYLIYINYFLIDSCRKYIPNLCFLSRCAPKGSLLSPLERELILSKGQITTLQANVTEFVSGLGSRCLRVQHSQWQTRIHPIKARHSLFIGNFTNETSKCNSISRTALPISLQKMSHAKLLTWKNLFKSILGTQIYRLIPCWKEFSFFIGQDKILGLFTYNCRIR